MPVVVIKSRRSGVDLRNLDLGSIGKRDRYFRQHTKEAKAKRTLDKIEFDSISEMKRYAELKVMERLGEISHLILQPVYHWKCGNEIMFYYTADFEYWQNGAQITEDVKSRKTRLDPIYRLKTKILRKLKIVDVTEVLRK